MDKDFARMGKNERRNLIKPNIQQKEM